MFTASDDQSGVHKIGFAITVRTEKKDKRVVYEGFAPASMDTNDNPLCDIIENKCFIPQQALVLDNCWFMISKSDLETSTASVEITAYNQALLTASTVFQAGSVKNLQGLEKYNGPENMRIESPTPNGFRVAWDLPEKSSCYGRAEIVIVLLRKQSNDDVKLETYYTPGTSKYFDILGLEAETDYRINLGMKLPTSPTVQQTGIALDVTTPSATAGPIRHVGLIVGVAVGVLAIVSLIVVTMVFLIKRGYFRYRRFPPSTIGSRPTKATDDTMPWNINRNEVKFEKLIKSGHFANIYTARLKSGKGSGDTVVAKTLKEGFTWDDELLMKAKINFIGEQVGHHPNVLDFIGAVVSDDAMGPFILYEYCEHGTLRDYLADRRQNVTLDLQENLFRFGLNIAKGMEYLANKGIVHRRLAARNILLTSLNEVKISGFGPQPWEKDERDSEKAKRERIPIKWVAPECMESTRDATEKNDVWSYAVVLWEIFSLGETPYAGKGTDLPRRLKKGERLDKPEQCDDVWYGVMKRCWSYEARRRPTFSEVRGELDNMFVASPGNDYYFYKL